jgi:hypothetical protein
MKRLIVAATITMAGSAFSAEHDEFQLRTASDLIEICSAQASDTHYASAIAFCHGVLAGAFRFYLATTPADQRFVCAPNPVPTRSKVMNDFVARAKAHPQHAQEPAVDTLFRYLGEAYPCQN